MQKIFDCQYINGRWCPSANKGCFIEVENPATFEKFARVPEGNNDDIDAAVVAAKSAYPSWSQTPMQKRLDLMQKMLDIFKSYEKDIIELEIKELGQPYAFTENLQCRYQFARIQSYIDCAAELELTQKLAQSTVYREPVGVVACITPWNYPLGQVVQKVIPAVLMGNTIVLKPSQHTPLTVYYLIEAFDRAGFPAGVVNLVSGKGSALGTRLATHPDVDMVSFTGSTRVGIQLSQLALGSVKRISLELGGKSPFVWLPSDDYAPAVGKLFDSIFLNAGQTCTALSRLLVPRADKEKIEALLVKRAKEYKAGDPTDATNRVGPVSSRAQFEKVREYIKLGLEEGARMIIGKVPGEATGGYVIEPVIFTDVTNDMRIAREEIFGPVLCVIAYDTIEEAVAIANDTIYGLNASVFGPKEKAVAVAHAIRAGNVYVNDAPRDITAPFGGYKQSGLGREGGYAGLLEFTQPKAIFDLSTY